MSGARVGSKDFLDERGIKAWANISTDFIQREMAPDKPLQTRVLHAMILLSWCGPDATEAVMRKDERGYVIKDAKGKPIPAELKDIADLLGVDKGNVTRMAQLFIAQGSLRKAGKVLYLVFTPTPFVSLPVVSTDNWNIAGVVVSTDNLPTDPVERAEAIRRLDVLSTNWKMDLLVVKTRHRELLRQALPGVGIIIEKNKKNSREEIQADAALLTAVEHLYKPSESSSSSVSSEPMTTIALVTEMKQPDEQDQVLAAMNEYSEAEPDAARKMITACRSFAPDATTEDICRKIDAKGLPARRAINPVGFLLDVVPKTFEGWRKPPGHAVSSHSDEELERIRSDTDRALAAGGD